jgi:hypothetical protein
MYIYLDTHMWDALLDGGVQPEQFVPRLARSNKRLVLGIHAFYESARVFRSQRSDALARGKMLFEFLTRCLEANVACAKDQSELLPAEMLILQKGASAVEFFYPREDYDKILAESRLLANGEQSELAKQFLLDQHNFAVKAVQGIIAHLDANPALKLELTQIAPENVEGWLRTESVTVQGHSNLARHIQLRFPMVPDNQIEEYAIALFSLPMKRYARGLVRADLYLHWRYARFGVLNESLAHDVYHVLNASYCDRYVTADRQQQYAPMLLTSNTKVSVWARDKAINDWLKSL